MDGSPSHLAKHFQSTDWASPDNAPFRCPTCGAMASTCKEAGCDGCDPGECLIMTCYNRKCKVTKFAFCKTCKEGMSERWATNGHAISREHVKEKEKQVNQLLNASIIPSPRSSPKRTHSEMEDSSNNEQEPEPTTMHVSDDCEALPESNQPQPQVYPMRKSIEHGNDWLLDLTSNQSEATTEDLNEAFEGNPNMNHFHIAEQNSPRGRCGGGLRFLVARAFYKTELIEKWHLPGSFNEARLQFEMFAQHQAMNDKERRRQANIHRELSKGNKGNPWVGVLTKTRIPTLSEMHGIYGRNGSHSLWNTLPVPTFENVEGIAYCSPMEICKFMFANAVPIDNMRAHQGSKNNGKDGIRFYVSQSRACEELLKKTENTQCLPLWCCDWRDGFGAQRTKNNRNSIVAWTLTVACPNEKINSTSNTFLMCLGLKKNKSWGKVEEKVHRDLKRMSNPLDPLKVHSLATKTMLKICLGRVAALEDRVERADATGTLSYASDHHRCFGKLLKVETARIKTKEIESYQKNEKEGNVDGKIKWGWCDQFVDTTSKTNGAALPACQRCRMRRLVTLGLPSSVLDQEEEFGDDLTCECSVCVDWKLDDDGEALMFKPPKDYPMTCNPNCPVPAPKGREAGLQKLGPVTLTHEFLRDAVRFAFYNTSCRTDKTINQKPWTQKTCWSYLRTCGVMADTQVKCFKAAESARGNNWEIDYKDNLKLGTFYFPPAWSSELGLNRHIELLMHQMCLGVAEDNFALCDRWFQTASIGVATFRNAMQPLLESLNSFHLSWMEAEAFSGQKGSYKTGAWVAENWLTWIRLSKCAHGWAAKDDTKARFRRGSNDMSRMVQAHVAVVARLMTHNGINNAMINETEHYIKEFMSCVRELDTRVRHREINTKPKDAKAKPKTKGKKTKANKRNDNGNGSINDNNNQGEGKPQEQSSQKSTSNASENKKKKFGLWWMKSNYISMFNLAPTMTWLGPLINWWDGGGKGERFTQEIKPFVTRGVRAESTTFFERLMERVYKSKSMSLLGQLYLNEVNEDDFDSDGDDIEEANNEEHLGNIDSDTDSDSSDSDSDSSDDEEEDNMEDSDDDEDPIETVPILPPDRHHMSKSRTVYIYKKEKDARDAITNGDPISGIIVEDDKEASGYSFYVVFRVTVKERKENSSLKFGWMRILFNDDNGTHFHGLWFASLSVANSHINNPPQSLVGIQSLARMAVVAISLKYLYTDDTMAKKYCAITNWWTERNKEGNYVLPSIDISLHNSEDLPLVQPAL